MMKIKYKHLCLRCKKNYVLISRKQGYPICYDCQKDELHTVIEDAKMKEFFDIPEKLYEQNGFLRNIKLSYIRNKSLTDKQIEGFKKVVEKLKQDT